MSRNEREMESDSVTEQEILIKKPRPYHVILHNDDYTTMEFVVMILETIFQHNPASATQLMLKVHNQGKTVVGTYSRDIAETKVSETTMLARKNGHPLRCTMKPA